MAIAEELAALRERTLAEIAAADTSAALEAVRVAVLGKSGTLTGYLRSMGQVPAEERASVGKCCERGPRGSGRGTGRPQGGTRCRRT